MTTGSYALREPLTDLVRARQPAEIGAFAGTGARHEKRHVGLLRAHRAARAQQDAMATITMEMVLFTSSSHQFGTNRPVARCATMLLNRNSVTRRR